MTNAERIARITAAGTATGEDLEFLLEYLGTHKAVLRNLVADYDKMGDPKPAFEAFSVEHARALTKGYRAPEL